MLNKSKIYNTICLLALVVWKNGIQKVGFPYKSFVILNAECTAVYIINVETLDAAQFTTSMIKDKIATIVKYLEITSNDHSKK